MYKHRPEGCASTTFAKICARVSQAHLLNLAGLVSGKGSEFSPGHLDPGGDHGPI